jgi:hypothetical protein
MGWFSTPDDPRTDGKERESGTRWWYIAGVAIGAGTG